MEIGKKLEGKTIKTAYVDGGEIEIVFTDGSVFTYDASPMADTLATIYAKEKSNEE